MFSMKNSSQKMHQKNSINDIGQKQKDEEQHPKTMSIIEFEPSLACRINSLAVKKANEVKPTTKLFSGKMLIFAKLFLESFTYDFSETFFFPNWKAKEIYDKYMIKLIFPYSVLTDTDSICLFHFHLQTRKQPAQRKI